MSSTSSLRLRARVSSGQCSRDVELPDRFAEAVVEHSHAALPARALLGNVVQRLAVEAEARVVERLGQDVRVVAEEAEGEIFLPRASGTSASRLPAAGTALGSATSTFFAAPRPHRAQRAGQSNCGASFVSCARVIGL